jgi:hypothetical protein
MSIIIYMNINKCSFILYDLIINKFKNKKNFFKIIMNNFFAFKIYQYLNLKYI